mmetsp:Transcript_27868/g.89879  ORF Transcript_27868/g.89879 Transcript_27868/m.89879 type:complete len:216 (+) Transcript_27868:889-1536(+)
MLRPWRRPHRVVARGPLAPKRPNHRRRRDPSRSNLPRVRRPRRRLRGHARGPLGVPALLRPRDRSPEDVPCHPHHPMRTRWHPRRGPRSSRRVQLRSPYRRPPSRRRLGRPPRHCARRLRMPGPRRLPRRPHAPGLRNRLDVRGRLATAPEEGHLVDILSECASGGSPIVTFVESLQHHGLSRMSVVVVDATGAGLLTIRLRHSCICVSHASSSF